MADRSAATPSSSSPDMETRSSQRLERIALFRDSPCGGTDHRDTTPGLLLAETRRWLHLHAAAVLWWLGEKRETCFKNAELLPGILFL